jgi:hypothetical protein
VWIWISTLGSQGGTVRTESAFSLKANVQALEAGNGDGPTTEQLSRNQDAASALNLIERLAGLTETKRTSTRRARLKMERLKAELRRIDRQTRRQPKSERQ